MASAEDDALFLVWSQEAGKVRPLWGVTLENQNASEVMLLGCAGRKMM